MKKLFHLYTILFTSIYSVTAQVTVYETTHNTSIPLRGVEISSIANGAYCSFGDAIQLAGTERFLNSIFVDFYTLSDISPFTVTMSLYTDCPTTTGAGVCGSGVGTLIPSSTKTVSVTPPTVTPLLFTVEFPYSGLDISQTDNTITVMINASRNDVFWTINETPVIGSLPTGDTVLSTLTRCGSIMPNNGCAKTFISSGLTIYNNVGMKIVASPNLKSDEFSAEEFSIFPNPTTNLIAVSSKNNTAIIAISLTDLNGRIFKDQSFDNLSSIEMNITNLATGMYLMNIASNKGTATKRIVKY